MNPGEIAQKAKNSRFYLWLLNVGLSRLVPFNKSHSFKVVEIDDNSLKLKLPYKKSNMNHLRGIHACALATLSELTTGLALMTYLDSKKYRIILKKLEMDYHYQGKMDIYAKFSLSNQWLNENVISPLENSEKTEICCEVEAHDTKGNHISTGRVYWQLKSWSKVKTKV
ncbi:DUF4442 domain-containing protein [Cytophagales bacterium RKSG123]|nr:DUF4442 domain-containing protein [Xanthovirga aplysinae]